MGLGKKIVFLTPYAKGARGNVTTTRRLQAGYKQLGYAVSVFTYTEQATCQELQSLLQESEYVHVLHFTRFSQWLAKKACSFEVPFLLTMGGTDVHVDLRDGNYNQSTLNLLEQAKYITCFSVEAKKIISQLQPAWKDKLVVIPQGVLLPKQVEQFVAQAKLKKVRQKEEFHLLLPAGLRPVKDVLHLLQAWRILAERIAGFRVTIIGEILSEDVLAEVEQAVEQHPFLYYRPAVPFEEMFSVYQEADVVLNTSVEEGQPTAICEAMALGIPVIVRDNVGNRSVVTHQETGFIYREPTQFISFVEEISKQEQNIKRMIDNAQQFITQNRSVDQEIRAYLKLLHA